MKLWLNVGDAAEYAGVCSDTIDTRANGARSVMSASADAGRFGSSASGSTTGTSAALRPPWPPRHGMAATWTVVPGQSFHDIAGLAHVVPRRV